MKTKPLKILVEGSPLYQSRSGVGQYTYNILSNLFEQDKSNKYFVYGFLFIGKKLKEPFPSLPKNVKYRMVRYFPSKLHNVLSRKVIVPPADMLTLTKPDIALFTNFVRPPMPLGAKSITIVYDLSYIKKAEHSNKKNNQLLMKEMARTIKKSNHIITISENSKEEIMDYYNLDPKKITIVNPAIDHRVFKPQPQMKVKGIKSKFKIKGKYILYTGTLEPRKNILGILNSYSGLPSKIKDEYTLVLAGGKGWRDESIYKRLDELKEEKIIITGYVADEDLPPLYTGASLFVYPSLYEGFGMPPLEAMACGVPVITSNNSSLPEVVGKAGIMIEAEDTKALTTNIAKVLTNSTRAKQMSADGLEQAKKFDWAVGAKKLLKVIQDVGSAKI